MESRIELSSFYETILQEGRIGASHISLYVALLYQMEKENSRTHLFVYRLKMMELAKISRRTYNKCMRDLAELGYIVYEPSTDPLKGSKVCLNKL
jgi:hypothetical protein